MTLQETIKERRRTLSLSQKDLAEMAELSLATIKDIERGEGNPSISVTLPRRKERYESAELFPFFSNMLPEGANRSVICRSLKIDEEDFFGMLEAMAGKDFIGAVADAMHRISV